MLNEFKTVIKVNICVCDRVPQFFLLQRPEVTYNERSVSGPKFLHSNTFEKCTSSHSAEKKSAELFCLFCLSSEVIYNHSLIFDIALYWPTIFIVTLVLWYNFMVMRTHSSTESTHVVRLVTCDIIFQYTQCVLIFLVIFMTNPYAAAYSTEAWLWCIDLRETRFDPKTQLKLCLIRESLKSINNSNHTLWENRAKETPYREIKLQSLQSY